jgi:hypothetical protein
MVQYLVLKYRSYRNSHHVADEPVLKYSDTHCVAVEPEDHAGTRHGLDPTVQAAINAGTEAFKQAYEEAFRKSQTIGTYKPPPRPPVFHSGDSFSSRNEPQDSWCKKSQDTQDTYVRPFQGSFSTEVSELDISTNSPEGERCDASPQEGLDRHDKV